MSYLISSSQRQPVALTWKLGRMCKGDANLYVVYSSQALQGISVSQVNPFTYIYSLAMDCLQQLLFLKLKSKNATATFHEFDTNNINYL